MATIRPSGYDSCDRPTLTIEGGVTNDEWWGVAPAVVGALEARGWQPSDDAVRQVLPPIARHGNAVVAVPPSPVRALPALAGVMTAVAGSRGRALILTSPALVAPLGLELAQLARAAELRLVSATGPARAARHLGAGTVDVLVTSPAVALALHTRSALAIDAITSVTLAWPEDWDADEAVTLLLADLPKEAERLVLTSDLTRVASLTERHARRSLVVGYPQSSQEGVAPPRSVRTLATPWSGRAQGLTTILETLDPTSVGVWTADRSAHESLADVLVEAPGAEIVMGSTPTSELVVCHDLPSPPELAAIGAGRDVVLLVPPGTERYAARLAPGSHPVREAGAVDRLRDRDALIRAEVVAAIKERDLSAAGYAIAPLFDRYDPQAIAAACYALWRRDLGNGAAQPATTTVVPAPEPRTPVGGIAHAKLWVGVGRRDEATTGDLVAVLIREVGLAREAIGRIEMRETFSLVEVPSGDAERVARALSGLTVRRRKLVARVDKGMPAKSGGARPPRR
jgi:ATP-dependent RNA helicase DeaD